MTAFLKIDRCTNCHQDRPWEWVPPLFLIGRVLAGTAVWRSQLLDGICAGCREAMSKKLYAEKLARSQHLALARLMGGERPYQECTFERYVVSPENRVAFEIAQRFSALRDNLFLWGPCGVGKTHLALALARRSFERRFSVEILKSPQLVRRMRMKEPDAEQAVIDRLANVGVLVLDDLGMGTDSAYSRQVLQEILDARNCHDRGGLVITSKYSFSMLADRMQDDTIPSRLAGMCQSVAMTGKDWRLYAQSLDHSTGD
jgi:DNA replication protein DnaC